MPNLLAYTALIIWPLISFELFRRLKPVPAIFFTIVGGYLLLPVKVAIDFPLIPPLDKETIPAIGALIGCIYIKRKNIDFIPKAGLERWLIVVLLISPLITVFNNQESVMLGDAMIPGLTIHDGLSAIINQYLILIPFILGLQLIKSYDDQLLLFKLLVIAGLCYSLPILFEIRMSPQLHTWIYGFFPHSFGQQIRFGGFRPVVFMGHGLLVSMFVAITLGAAVLLWKAGIKTLRFQPFVVVIYFFVLLFLCKSVGAFLLGTFLLFAIKWMSIRVLQRASIFFIAIAIFYPALSIFDLFPHQQLVEIAGDFDEDRAQSLDFRFYHENRLLEHAQGKLFFGWGGWGRNRLSDSVTDGYWIIVLGQYGIIGFAALFGLAVLAVWRGVTLSRQINDKKQQHLLVSHVLIVSIIMVDQLPNHSLYSWLWFLIGALLGRVNCVIKEKVENRCDTIIGS